MAETSIAGQAFTSRSTTADGSWMAWSAAGISGIGAMVTPLAAAVLTALAGITAGVFATTPERG